MNPSRRLTYDFYNLTYGDREEVAIRVGLIEDGDYNLEKNDRYQLYFRRARERGLLETLWDVVRDVGELNSDLLNNPFVGH